MFPSRVAGCESQLSGQAIVGNAGPDQNVILAGLTAQALPALRAQVLVLSQGPSWQDAGEAQAQPRDARTS